uniref:RRM domain-containing protein n=1 Tax=Rhabditophanes sp. KR3021 TaxID=114890 RepID=A0AC35UGZ9_9BILA
MNEGGQPNMFQSRNSSNFANVTAFRQNYTAPPVNYNTPPPANFIIPHVNYNAPPPGILNAPPGNFNAPSGNYNVPPGNFNAPPGNFNAPPTHLNASQGNYIASHFLPTKNIAPSNLGSDTPPNMRHMPSHNLGPVQPQALNTPPKFYQHLSMNNEGPSNINHVKPVQQHQFGGPYLSSGIVDKNVIPRTQPMAINMPQPLLLKTPVLDAYIPSYEKPTAMPINSALTNEALRISKENEKNPIPDVLTSTNLYVYGLPVPFTDDLVKNTFGTYGPLLTWNITKNTETTPKHISGYSYTFGFVHFASRRDAERCIVGMNDEIFENRKLKISFASEKNKNDERKIVYYPKSLIKYLPSMNDIGMLFNCETNSHVLAKGMDNFAPNFDLKRLTNSVELNKPGYAGSFLDLHKKSYVKVFIPENERVLLRIHQLIRIGLVPEYCDFHNIISRIILNKAIMVYESNEEKISTLNIIKAGTIENNYLLWKSYSIACGESIDKWSTKGVRIFEKGPIFVPPCSKFKLWKEMPEFLYKTAYNYKKLTAKELRDRGLLNDGDKEKLQSILKNKDLSQEQIGNGFLFMAEHVGECKDVIDQVKNTLTNLNDPFIYINIWYIINDVLFNAKNCKERNLQPYLTEFRIEIESIFGLVFKYYDSLTCQEEKSEFKRRIAKVLSLWDDPEIFDTHLVLKLSNKLHNINTVMPEFLSNKKKSVPQITTILPTPCEPTADISHHLRITYFNDYLKKMKWRR